ncbi:hypothetical protein O6H91_07G098300 [Diphasiastrum complanatum]|uniref:Uncharacterized protein n=1 Tax=Diphasiastrum complanatum TaxID=34168 RepID=A0ACC2D8E1_DIPCM|nr:hypothetical protein O6H91_07G098300 [Diphasiastrum complanatum]
MAAAAVGYLRRLNHQTKEHTKFLQSIPKCFSRFMSLQVERALDPGQPTPETHPEVLSEGQIMPGIHASEFLTRRENLMKLLPKDSLVILGSASIQQMTDVVPYPFRQDADYLYFTGCQQPGGVAVLSGHSNFCMFMPDSDPKDDAWNGCQADQFAACNVFGASQAYSTRQLPQILTPMLSQKNAIFYDGSSLDPRFWRLPPIQQAMSRKRVQNLRKYTHQVRWIKSQAEIDLMRQSAGIASQAFLQSMITSKSWPHEHILAATIEYECKIRGAQRMAFPSVVGGGNNGTIIHYSRNDQQIQEGDMVLVDAGCEFYGYASDITRTWPPCGKFYPAQVRSLLTMHSEFRYILHVMAVKLPEHRILFLNAPLSPFWIFEHPSFHRNSFSGGFGWIRRLGSAFALVLYDLHFSD